jgi:hypothetical protein
MKGFCLRGLAVVILVIGWNVSVHGFHDGGVGTCGGCHGKKGGRWLLRGSDASSTCLICHVGEGSSDVEPVASRNGTAMSPGGDFYWVTKLFSWAGGSSPGDSHGHNVVARDFGFRQDARLSRSPGGSYPSSDLGCNSCHDPHGKADPRAPSSRGPASSGGAARGNYRLLGGVGYDGGAAARGFSFKYPAPVAGKPPAGKHAESDSSHVDYGSGMSDWCRNCHDRIHEAGTPFVHPAGAHLKNGMVDRYNRYVKSGNLSGSSATSYLALVPFERGTADTGRLDFSSIRGPDSESRVMCLTCHRAHGSAFRAIGRWDFDARTIAQSHPGPSDLGVSGSDVFLSYYGRDMTSTFGTSQGRLCEKCHTP